MKLQLSEIATAVQGELIGADIAVNGVGIDTRTLQAGDLYIAIKGKQFDGHDFVDKAQQAGAIAILVQRQINTDLPQIVVKDSHLALAELAGFWRKQLAVKVVGVTGSNGKTTVKEMIAAILATQGETLFTQGNLNNDIGVPLTLLKLNASHRYAVIEMGANHPGEIAYTSRYAQPQVSVITNVGAAHIEGFGDIQGVAKTKGEIVETLAADGVAVINRDDVFYGFWCDLAKSRKTVAFGFSEQADLRAENINTELQSNGYVTEFDLKIAGREGLTIKLNLAGEHNVKNALAAIAATLQFDVDLQDIKRGLETVKPVTGRMQPLLGRKGNLIIDDTYNANPSSLNAALAVLKPNQTNWLVLGAFGELGADSADIHRQMGDSIKAMPVQRLFATGALAKHSVEAFGDGGQYFETQQALIAALDEAVTGQETLLVKGSRSQKMENVVAAMVDNFRAA